jgi:DNA repair protein RadC
MQKQYSYSKEFLLSELYALETADPVKKITTPADIVPAVQEYAYKDQEHFIVVDLNGEHVINEIRVISKGLVNRTLVHPREIFRGAIVNNAAAIILIHNHPSGNTEPSNEDKEITTRINNASKIIGIEIIDHIIISKRGYYSFVEEGLL